MKIKHTDGIDHSAVTDEHFCNLGVVGSDGQIERSLQLTVKGIEIRGGFLKEENMRKDADLNFIQKRSMANSANLNI